MNHDEHQTELDSELSAKDAAAVDALFGAGFDIARLPQSAERKRVAKVSALLGLLRAGPAADPSLADVTLARVNRLAQSSGLAGTLDHTPALSVDDQEALDALVMSGFDPARVASSLRGRAARQGEVLSLLATPAAAGHGDLVQRTLDTIQRHIDESEDVYSLAGNRERSGGRGGMRLRDLLSVAAVILIGSAVLLPVMSSFREQGRRTLCKANLGETAQGMSTYASANRDSLPMAAASLAPGGTWWQVGKEPKQSNSANLFTLTRAGYVPLSRLACPGNPAAPTASPAPGALDWRRLEEVSYSYQIMFGALRPVWKRGPEAVVLADRSPVVLRAIRGEAVDPCSNAPNHACEGQHTLRNDGSVAWLASPVLPGGDNIWLPRSVEIRLRSLVKQTTVSPIRGNETPEGADDTFLGP